MLLKDFISMEILPFKKWKVTFADGSYVVVDARSNWEAIKIAKPMSRLTTVDARKLTGWEVEILERRMRKNVAITSEIVKEAKGESSKLLERLSKIDRNSGEARKIRRQLRKLGVSLSKAVSREHLRKKVVEGERRRYIKKSIETPLMTKRERKKVSGSGIRTDQVLDTAEVLVKRVGYKSKPELVKRLMEMYPRLTEDRAGGIAGQVLFQKNPPAGARKIYDDVLAVEARKGRGSLFPGELFRHDFKSKKGKASIYGLPDGSLLIKGRKKLWKEFNYD